MRIKHSQLDDFRKNPSRFNSPIIDDSSPMNFSYSNALRLSIYQLHNKMNNIILAHEYLQELCNRHFNNSFRIAQVHQDLDNYFKSYRSLNSVTFATKYRLDSKIFHDLIIGGEISRIDSKINSIGYIAYLFVSKLTDWQKEFRMPILQYCISEELNCSLKEVEVGICSLDCFSHESKCFSESEVQTALLELEELYKKIM